MNWTHSILPPMFFIMHCSHLLIGHLSLYADAGGSTSHTILFPGQFLTFFCLEMESAAATFDETGVLDDFRFAFVASGGFMTWREFKVQEYMDLSDDTRQTCDLIGDKMKTLKSLCMSRHRKRAPYKKYDGLDPNLIFKEIVMMSAEIMLLL